MAPEHWTWGCCEPRHITCAVSQQAQEERGPGHGEGLGSWHLRLSSSWSPLTPPGRELLAMQISQAQGCCLGSVAAEKAQTLRTQEGGWSSSPHLLLRGSSKVQ